MNPTSALLHHSHHACSSAVQVKKVKRKSPSTYCFIPCGLYHFQIRKPAFNQSPRVQTTKKFKLRIVCYQTCHTRFIQMVKMIMTNKQIIYLTKDRRIGRKLTSAFDKRNASIYRINHQTLSTQLKKKRVMPEPYQ